MDIFNRLICNLIHNNLILLYLYLHISSILANFLFTKWWNYPQLNYHVTWLHNVVLFLPPISPFLHMIFMANIVLPVTGYFYFIQIYCVVNLTVHGLQHLVNVTDERTAGWKEYHPVKNVDSFTAVQMWHIAAIKGRNITYHRPPIEWALAYSVVPCFAQYGFFHHRTKSLSKLSSQ